MSTNERMTIGSILDMTAEERRALRLAIRARRTTARAQRRLAAGVRLCGAKTRSGRPCIAKGTGKGGRCRMHGGTSTGPKTPEGRAKALDALRRANERRAAQRQGKETQ